jgi:hypothetical protein
MSSSSAFNPSRIRRESEPKVERVGSATFSFRDVYTGAMEFFNDRPIEVDGDDTGQVDTELLVKERK